MTEDVFCRFSQIWAIALTGALAACVLARLLASFIKGLFISEEEARQLYELHPEWFTPEQAARMEKRKGKPKRGEDDDDA